MIVPNAAAACPYRVGDYLFSESETHPSTSWPGTSWVQVQGRTILGAGEDYPVGSEGGEAEHTLTEDELPEISGNIYSGSGKAPPKQRGNRSVPLWRRCILGKPRTGKGSCEQRQYCVARRKRLRLCQPRIWWWPAPQQSDAIPRGVHLAADCVTPGRGCAA